jgi:5,10-methylenetetrahydrofolate reductase
MSNFSEALDSGRSLVTCELNPPKGVDLGPVFEKAGLLEGWVDAFNVTDSASSRMTMAPIAVAHLLQDRGFEPILQVTCRDRNRLALQSEVLAASALGIGNVLCMSGDPPGAGDHPDAKTVFDIDAIGLLRAVEALKSGSDMAGNDLRGVPEINAGAVANPGAEDLDKEMRRMEDKVKAGARFFQTQAVYDPRAFEGFVSAARRFNVPILAGLIVLKSARMARNLNASLPGVHVPKGIVDEMENAKSRQDKSVEISARIIREIRPMCRGVHIMAIGWESKVPLILEAAGVSGGG